MNQRPYKYEIMMKILEIIEDDPVDDSNGEASKIIIEHLNGLVIQSQTKINRIEGDSVMGNQQNSGTNKVSLNNTHISGDLVASTGPNSNSFNKTNATDINELTRLANQLTVAVENMVCNLPSNTADEIKDDLEKLLEQINRQHPKRRWWTVSIDGLSEAAKTVGEVGTPVLEVLKQIVPILSGLSE